VIVDLKGERVTWMLEKTVSEESAYASSHRLAENNKWMTWSSSSDWERKYESIIFPIAVVRSFFFIFQYKFRRVSCKGEQRRQYQYLCTSIREVHTRKLEQSSPHPHWFETGMEKIDLGSFAWTVQAFYHDKRCTFLHADRRNDAGLVNCWHNSDRPTIISKE